MREKKELNVQMGERIRSARERAGLTQEQLGELVSLGAKNVSDIERGVTGITVATLKRLCEALSVSSDRLLFGDEAGNDLDRLSERLSRLPPDRFAAVEDFLNQVLRLFANLSR